jgi:hypothetical protein
VNTFNRLVVIVLLVLAIAVCTVTLAVPTQMVQFVQWIGRSLGEWLGGPESSLLDATKDISVIGRLGMGVLAVLIDLGLGVLLYYEIRRARKKATIRARGTTAEISPASIEAQVRKVVDKIPGLIDVDVSVKAAVGGRAQIKLDVLAEPGVLVASKVKEINKTVRRVAKRSLGLRLASGPIIHVELASPSAVAHADEVLSAPALPATAGYVVEEPAPIETETVEAKAAEEPDELAPAGEPVTFAPLFQAEKQEAVVAQDWDKPVEPVAPPEPVAFEASYDAVGAQEEPVMPQFEPASDNAIESPEMVANESLEEDVEATSDITADTGEDAEDEQPDKRKKRWGLFGG